MTFFHASFFLAKLFFIFLLNIINLILKTCCQFDPCYTWWKNTINKCSSYKNEVIVAKSLLFIATDSTLKCAKAIIDIIITKQNESVCKMNIRTPHQEESHCFQIWTADYIQWSGNQLQKFSPFQVLFNVVVIWCFPPLLPSPTVVAT